jgi:hypothetical protein
MQKTSKVLPQNADIHAGDFSGARASFFVRLSMKIGAGTGKNNGIWGGRNPYGSVSPCPFPGKGCTEPSVRARKLEHQS